MSLAVAKNGSSLQEKKIVNRFRPSKLFGKMTSELASKILLNVGWKCRPSLSGMLSKVCILLHLSFWNVFDKDI